MWLLSWGVMVVCNDVDFTSRKIHLSSAQVGIYGLVRVRLQRGLTLLGRASFAQTLNLTFRMGKKASVYLPITPRHVTFSVRFLVWSRHGLQMPLQQDFSLSDKQDTMPGDAVR